MFLIKFRKTLAIYLNISSTLTLLFPLDSSCVFRLVSSVPQILEALHIFLSLFLMTYVYIY